MHDPPHLLFLFFLGKRMFLHLLDFLLTSLGIIPVSLAKIRLFHTSHNTGKSFLGFHPFIKEP